MGSEKLIIGAEAGQLMILAGGDMVQREVVHEQPWACRLGRVMCARAWEIELDFDLVL